MSEPADRPSIVLHGFLGGIVNNPSVALGLARVLNDARTAQRKSIDRPPLVALDGGDRWSIRTANGDASNDRVVDIRKSDAAVLSLGGLKPHEVLPNEDTVERFAAVLAGNAGGPDEGKQQSPFTIADRGDAWLVRGSRNADRAVEGPGPFVLEVRKRDGRVMDMFFEGVLHVPLEVEAAMRK